MVKRISNQPWLLNVNSSLVILATGEYTCTICLHRILPCENDNQGMPMRDAGKADFLSTKILYLPLQIFCVVVCRMRFVSDNACRPI